MRIKATAAAAALFFLAFLTGCGGSGADSGFPDDVPTQVNPLVSRVGPATGPAGTEITIYGMGFSISYPNNIVIVGDAATSATGYALVSPPTADEIESITAVVPNDAAPGDNSVYVVVYDNASNTDVTFTVTP